MLKILSNRDILLEIAKKFGTPTYVYFEEIIKENVKKYYEAFDYDKFHLLYAYKANTNLEICKILKDLNLGADVVSGGELYLVKILGLNPEYVIFTSNGKSDDEIEEAINFDCIINIDGIEEMEIVEEISKKLNKVPKISFRINPEVNPHTHDKIATGVKESKFGININQAVEAYKIAKQKNFEILGIHSHIGSQITEIEPFEEEAEKIAKLVMKLQKDLKINLRFIDLGGGLGIDYEHEGKNILTHKELAKTIVPIIKDLNKNLGYEIELWLEPGRSIVGNAGILLTKVLSIKETPYKKFINVDTGFNHLIRPAMYNAYHKIINISDITDLEQNKPETNNDLYDIAGNLCESGDILGKDRKIKAKRNDILAILDTGAYGFSMSSNYNSKLKPCEILIKKNEIKVIREREKYEDLFRIL